MEDQKKVFFSVLRFKEVSIRNYFPNTKTAAESIRHATALITFPINVPLDLYPVKLLEKTGRPWYKVEPKDEMSRKLL